VSEKCGRFLRYIQIIWTKSFEKSDKFSFEILIKYEIHGQEKPGKPDKTRKFSASRSVQRMIVFWILPIILIPYRQQSFGMLENVILKKPSKFVSVGFRPI
jgi:hypothetical protein